MLKWAWERCFCLTFSLYQAAHIIPFPNAHLTFFVNQLASIFTEIERYFHLILRQTYDFIDFKKTPTFLSKIELFQKSEKQKKTHATLVPIFMRTCHEKMRILM